MYSDGRRVTARSFSRSDGVTPRRTGWHDGLATE